MSIWLSDKDDFPGSYDSGSSDLPLGGINLNGCLDEDSLATVEPLEERKITDDKPPEVLSKLEQLRQAALDLPHSSGVYLMKDKDEKIIYVGKAKILPRRVVSYFQKTPVSARIGLMVEQVDCFDFVLTATEKEALILENSLIKKYHPKYNVVLRDDKTYPSLRLSVTEPYPRLEIVRRPVKDGSVIFGPFPSASSLRETLKMVNRIFPLRQCRRPDVKKVDRPCLNFQMGRCVGPCRPELSAEEYRALTEEVRLFFKGRHQDLIKSLESSMKEAASRYDFELAARFRDRLTDLKKTLEHQVVMQVEDKDQDIWALVRCDGFNQAAVLNVRSGAVFGCQPLAAEGDSEEELEIVMSMVSQYYGAGQFVPDEVWVPVLPEAEETSLVVDWLSTLKGRSVKLGCPKRGDRLRLLEMASENARVTLVERLDHMTKTRGVMVELEAKLGLKKIPRRLECFDLAHLAGQAAVGGMVVMEEGEWNKKEYRRFKIKKAKGGDDYGGLREVISRRFAPDKKADHWAWPDLLLIDGGRGQLTAVMMAFDDLGIKPPPTAGIAKDREGGGPDRIFLPGRKNPVDLKPGSAGLMILSRLRDEAHRYCRSYHHSLRSSQMLESLFGGLKGLGPIRLKALTDHFETLDDLAKASDQDILKLAPIPSESLAELRKNLARILNPVLIKNNMVDEAE